MFVYLVKNWDLNVLQVYKKVRLQFSVSHRGSDNSQLLIVFSANYIDQPIVTFIRLKVLTC